MCPVPILRRKKAIPAENHLRLSRLELQNSRIISSFQQDTVSIRVHTPTSENPVTGNKPSKVV
jgi:hypothetical protein